VWKTSPDMMSIMPAISGAAPYHQVVPIIGSKLASSAAPVTSIASIVMMPESSQPIIMNPQISHILIQLGILEV
jgi:hypothetical protein